MLSTALQLEKGEGDCRSIDRDFMYGKVTSTSKRQSVGQSLDNSLSLTLRQNADMAELNIWSRSGQCPSFRSTL